MGSSGAVAEPGGTACSISVHNPVLYIRHCTSMGRQEKKGHIYMCMLGVLNTPNSK